MTYQNIVVNCIFELVNYYAERGLQEGKRAQGYTRRFQQGVGLDRDVSIECRQ